MFPTKNTHPQASKWISIIPIEHIVPPAIGLLINVKSHTRDVYTSAWEGVLEVSNQLEIRQFHSILKGANLTLQADFVRLNQA